MFSSELHNYERSDSTVEFQSNSMIDDFDYKPKKIATENWEKLKKARHPFAAIIKPTDNCNMACPYCYVDHKSTKLWMEDDVLEATIMKMTELIQNQRSIHFIWHGGEPLLLGLDFFKKVIALQRKYCLGMKIENCIQTNGTLLTEEIVQFFVKNHFSISLSIDGPASIHNINRKFSNGEGSFDKVMQSVTLLRKYRQVIGAVAVMTKATLPNIGDLYSFMKQLSIQFRINPIIQSESDRQNYKVNGITALEYGKAMQELFDLWFFDDTPIHIDPINLIVGNMISNTVWGCDYHGGCLQDIICINPDGNLYPCGQFAGNEEFYMGNILKDSIETILSSPVFIKVRQRSPKLIEECQSCEFMGICNAGCMLAAWMRGKGILAPDYFCEGRKLLFAHIRKRLKDEIDRIQKLTKTNITNYD